MQERRGRTRRRREPRQRDGGTFRLELGLAAVLVTSVILLGSAHFYVATALAGCICLAAVMGGERVSSGWGAPSKLCLALAAWTSLSVLPIPPVLLGKAAHQSAELWRSCFALTGHNQSTWTPLSLDPIASASETAKWASYAFVSAAAGTVGRRKGLNPTLRIVWGCAVLVALVSIIQTISGLTTVLGVYQPVSQNVVAKPGLLVNPNNLAGFCNLGAFSGMGLLSSRRNRIPRPVLYVGTILCGVTTILTASRGGTFTLLLGVVLLLAWWFFRGPTAELARYRSAFVGTAVALVTGAALTVLSATDETWRDLLNDDVTKFENLARLGPALANHWLFGVGRGAFETVSFLYYGETQHVVHRSIENFAVSWAIEWGLPATLLGLGYGSWFLRPARLKLGSHRPAQAAYAALVVIALQNMGDLGFELFSLTAALFAIFGALDGSRNERGAGAKTETEAEESNSRSTLLIRVPAGASVLLAAAALYLGPDNFSVKQELYREVSHSTSEPGLNFSKIKDTLTREMKWRPGEPYFALLGAEAALREGVDALPWASAALSRAPHYARAHLITARSLLQRDSLAQATLHLRTALEGEQQLYDSIAELVASRTTDLKLIEAVAPQSRIGAVYLLAVRQRLNAEHPHLGAQLLERAVARAPLEEKVLAAQGFQLVADLARGSYTCGPEGKLCKITDRSKWAQRIRSTANKHPESYTCANRRILSRLEQIEGRNQQAWNALDRCTGCQVAEPCMGDLVALASQLKEREKLKEAERLYLEAVCTLPATCAKAERWLGQQASARQDWLAATSHFSQLASFEPDGANWLLVADAAARASQVAHAELAYQRATALGATNERIAASIRKARLDLLRR